MSSEALYLALDQGGHATRAIVFREQGDVVAEFSVPISTSHPEPDRVEHDPEEMALSVSQALAGVAELLGSRVRQIVAAGFATQRSSVAFWDRTTGRPLAPIASWQDRRDAESLLQTAGAHEETIISTTGLRVSPHYGANKLRWFLRHNTAVAEAAAAGTLRCGPMASYLLARAIPGCPAFADPANASRTLLWDLHRKDWSPELLSLFGIPQELLPSSVPSRHHYGSMPVGGHQVPVSVCTGDQSAAIFASGALDMEAAYVNIGTGAFIQKPTAVTRSTAAPLLQSVVWRDEAEELLVLEGTINGAAAALVEYIEPAVPDWSRRLDGWLESVTDPPLFMNGVSGLAAPYWVHDFPTRFIPAAASGSTRPTEDPAHQAVAIAESIVFLLQENIQVLASKGEPIQRLVVTGGLAASNALCRRLADLSGCLVLRPRFTEATARGLCYLLRSGNPAATEEQWRSAMARPEEFLPAANATLQARYAAWRQELEASISG